jgi:hypothetical protein
MDPCIIFVSNTASRSKHIPATAQSFVWNVQLFPAIKITIPAVKIISLPGGDYSKQVVPDAAPSSWDGALPSPVSVTLLDEGLDLPLEMEAYDPVDTSLDDWNDLLLDVADWI